MFGVTTYRLLFVVGLISFVLLFSESRIFGVEAVALLVPDLNYQVVGSVPNLDVSAYAVFDLETGEVLASKNSSEVRSIASVTKLFGATALLRHYDLETEIVVTSQDLLADGRAGKLEAGNIYTYRELLFPLLLESSNDAAAAYERVTEKKLIIQMNDLASELNLNNTSFSDVSGLSDRNVSNVDDLIIFLTYLHKAEPYLLDVTKLTQYIGPYTGWMNNSPVLDGQYIGGKHGYTEAAGRTIIAMFEEEVSSEMRDIGYVVLGSADLAADMAKLRAFVHEGVVYE